MTPGCSYYKSVSVGSVFAVSGEQGWNLCTAKHNTGSKHNSADASAAQTRTVPPVKLFRNTVLVLRWVEK